MLTVCIIDLTSNIVPLPAVVYPPAPSKYLLILDNWYREQLTQMAIVVGQVIHLAKLTNRTVVLPYVAKSHLWWPGARGFLTLGDVPLLKFGEYFDLNYTAIGIQPNGTLDKLRTKAPAGSCSKPAVIEMEEYLSRTGINRQVVELFGLCQGPWCSSSWKTYPHCEGAPYPVDNFQEWILGKTVINDGSWQTRGYFWLKERMCFQVRCVCVCVCVCVFVCLCLFFF